MVHSFSFSYFKHMVYNNSHSQAHSLAYTLTIPLMYNLVLWNNFLKNKDSHLSISQAIWLSICLYIIQSIHPPFIHHYTCLSVFCLSVCLFVCLFWETLLHIQQISLEAFFSINSLKHVTLKDLVEFFQIFVTTFCCFFVKICFGNIK